MTFNEWMNQRYATWGQIGWTNASRSNNYVLSDLEEAFLAGTVAAPLPEAAAPLNEEELYFLEKLILDVENPEQRAHIAGFSPMRLDFMARMLRRALSAASPLGTHSNKGEVMKTHKGYTLYEVLIVLVILAGGFGWCWNIVKLIGMNLDPITGLLIVRAIGIFVFPVGMIVGYF